MIRWCQERYFSPNSVLRVALSQPDDHGAKGTSGQLLAADSRISLLSVFTIRQCLSIFFSPDILLIRSMVRVWALLAEETYCGEHR